MRVHARLPTAALTALFCAANVAFTTPSLACGGCFAPPGDQSAVTGHRMVFAVSVERTVLWDQFEYSGHPEEFAWVLPIAPGAYLELANQAWFDMLEGATLANVEPPPSACAAKESSGCAFDEGEGSAAIEAGVDDLVRVLHRDNVGPYETVTLRSEDGEALANWLGDNGFYLPDDIAPLIDDYVEEGSDFLALKLLPGRDVSRMEPVRVVTPKGEPVLPLRMVAAGVADEVDIVLYVIGEQRYSILGLEQREIDDAELVWNSVNFSSNYEQLRNSMLSEGSGRNLLTTYAERGALTDPDTTLIIENDVDSGFGNWWDIYVQLGGGHRCGSGLPADGSRRVVDPCYGRDDTEPPIPCKTAKSTQQSSSEYACGKLTDFSAALVGMIPNKTWLTRLEMRLPREALDMDCEVFPIDPDPVSNRHQAKQFEGDPPCDLPLFSASVQPLPSGRVPLTASLFSLVAAAVIARRWRRTGRQPPS